MIDPPEIITTVPVHYAGIHLQVPVAEIRQQMGTALSEVGQLLREQHLPPTGSWFTHHFRRPTDTFDFEVCLPVERAIEPEGRVYPGIWTAMRVVRTVYHGSYTELPHAWGELSAWMQSQSLTGQESFWEVYTINPNTAPIPRTTARS